MKKNCIPEKRTDAAGEPATEPVTKLVEDPKALTAAEIKEASGDDGSNKRENSANADVQEQLTAEKRKGTAASEHVAYFGGQGGAAGI